jgi:hypothetical protein
MYTIYLFVHSSCFQSVSLDANNFENLQELDIQYFEQQVMREQGK